MSMSVGPCLAYRLGTAKAAKLGVEGKRDCVESLCRKRRAPGVLAYDGDEVVGWAAIAPRDELVEFAGDDPFPRVDDAEVWSLFCLRAQGGVRRLPAHPDAPHPHCLTHPPRTGPTTAQDRPNYRP